MLRMRPPTTEQTAADPSLRRGAISFIILATMRHGASLRSALDAVPAECARNETGAELLIEDSKMNKDRARFRTARSASGRRQ
jgi:hypothetical protein